jgi:HSP20 family protein
VPKNMKKTKTKSATRWRPFAGLKAVERERVLEDFFSRRLHPGRQERWFKTDRLGVTLPAVDLFEEEDELVVSAELPGVQKQDIDVELTDHMLTIKGEKKKKEQVNEAGYYRAERLYGSFLRTLDLPKDVEGGKIRASFKDGVLEIRMPKTKEAKSKEIKINID